MTEVRELIENTDLARGSEGRNRLYKQLPTISLWLAAAEEISHLDDYAEIALADVRLVAAGRDGSRGEFLFGFSSRDLGLEFRNSAHPLLEVKGEMLIQQFPELPHAGLVIDPESEPFVELTRRELLALAADRHPNAAAEKITGQLETRDVARPTIKIPEAWARALAEVLLRAKSVTAAYVVDIRIGGVMGPRLVIQFVSDGNPDFDPDAATLFLEQLRKTFGELVDVLTTDEPALLSACRSLGRRLF